MKLTDIPRIKAGSALALASEISDLSSERGKLAQRAADLLGYRQLANHVSGRGSLATEVGKLAAALQTIEIQVLDTESVITYQMEESGRRTRDKINEVGLKGWATGWGLTAAHWQHVDLKEYDRPIPEFVIDKAVKIKEAIPEVEFRVHHLNDARYDPFLIAHLGKEIYYIDAWDEPRFEQNL
jgi:hypothetical protein